MSKAARSWSWWATPSASRGSGRPAPGEDFAELAGAEQARGDQVHRGGSDRRGGVDAEVAEVVAAARPEAEAGDRPGRRRGQDAGDRDPRRAGEDGAAVEAPDAAAEEHEQDRKLRDAGGADPARDPDAA